MRPRRTGLVGLLLGLLIVLAGSGPTSGHTSISLVSPPDGSRLDLAPAELVVGFSEALPVDNAHVRVALSSGKAVVEGALSSDSDAPADTQGRLRLPDLGTGSYLVTVTASGPDGHTVREVFAFTVGDAPLVRAEQAVAPSDRPLIRGMAWGGSLIGSLSLIALGFVYVASWCWRGATRSRRGRRVAAWGVGLGVVATLFELTALVLARDGAFLEAIGSQTGRLLGLRAIGLAAVAAAVAAWVRRDFVDDQDIARRQNLLFAAAIPLLLAIAGVSHAAGDIWAMVTLLVGMVHLGAMSIWLGGLGWIWLLLRDNARTPIETAGAFSRTARNAALATLASGAFLGLRLTDLLSAEVLASPYGLVLAVKLALVAALVSAAKRTNGLVVGAASEGRTPGLAADLAAGATPGVTSVARVPRLAAALRTEVVLAGAVLIAAGLLTVVSRGG